MNPKVALIMALSALASGEALAADNRIKTLPYDADEIVAIVGHSGIQSTIQFGPDERIENVAVGDSSAWQITPNRRGTVLFVKPLAPVSLTNMTVVTDRRTYMFDLSAGRKAGPPLYALKFSYTDVPPVSATPAEQRGAAMVSASVPTINLTTPERLNFAWTVKGSSRLRPARIFDDGASLYLSWASDVPLPAILTAVEKGREAPLNYRITGEYIVVSPIPHSLVLRYGKHSATAWTTRRPSASDLPPISPRLTPTPQEPVVIASDSRFAIRTASASPRPQKQFIPAVAQSRAAASSVESPNAAELLNDKLADSPHDH